MSAVLERPPGRHGRARRADGASWWLCLGAVLVGAALLRFVGLAENPGWEWDEPVYDSISSSLAAGTGLHSTTQFGAVEQRYLYHPPFHFLAVGLWYEVFGSGITQARAFGATASLVSTTLIAVALRRLVSPLAGLLAAAVLATDAWLVFANRVSWIDNGLMVFVGLSLLAWERALRRQERSAWLLLGAALAAAVVYKHIAVALLPGAALTFLLLRGRIRRPVRAALVTLGAAAALVVAYGLVMAALFPDEWPRQNLGQFDRSTGGRASRGTIPLDPGIVMDALALNYWLYTGTLVGTLVGFLLGVRRAWGVWRGRLTWQGLAPLLGMGVGAAGCLVVLSIRFPHYFTLVYVPMLAYLAGEAAIAWRATSTPGAGRVGAGRVAVAAGLVLLLGAGVSGGIMRLTWPADRHTMLEASDWLDRHARPGDVVVTEEPIGQLVAFPHCRVSRAEECDDDYSWVVVYNSLTQQNSDNQALQRYLTRETELCVVFTGFKERVMVYAHVAGSQDPRLRRSCG